MLLLHVVDGDLSINKLLFIPVWAYNKDTATLISSSPRGHIVSYHIISYISVVVDGDLSINKLLFIPVRAYNKDAATLISRGPRGHIVSYRITSYYIVSHHIILYHMLYIYCSGWRPEHQQVTIHTSTCVQQRRGHVDIQRSQRTYSHVERLPRGITQSTISGGKIL